MISVATHQAWMCTGRDGCCLPTSRSLEDVFRIFEHQNPVHQSPVMRLACSPWPWRELPTEQEAARARTKLESHLAA